MDVGGGRPFFSGPTGHLDLALLGVQTFTSGVVQLRYAPSAETIASP